MKKKYIDIEYVQNHLTKGIETFYAGSPNGRSLWYKVSLDDNGQLRAFFVVRDHSRAVVFVSTDMQEVIEQFEALPD